MKILILANNDVGLYQFRKELIEKFLIEHEVYISLPYGSFIDEFIKIGCKFINTPIDRRGVNPIKDIRLLLHYIKLIHGLHPDKVITYTIKPNIYGGIASRLLRNNLYANITGLGTAFENTGLLKKIVIHLYKIALKNARRIFFENSDNLSTITNYKIATAENTVLLNGAGVNLKKFLPLPYPAETKITRFLFIGRIMKEKGIDELLKACARLHNESFKFVLEVLGFFEEDYAAIFHKYQNEGWLLYSGYQKDVQPYIKNCHCFVLPSWHEGMANTNLEAAASARPIITSNIPGCREAVINTISGYLCIPKDSNDLYIQLKKFITLSNDEKFAMGIAGREHISINFDKNDVVNITCAELFNS